MTAFSTRLGALLVTIAIAGACARPAAASGTGTGGGAPLQTVYPGQHPLIPGASGGSTAHPRRSPFGANRPAAQTRAPLTPAAASASSTTTATIDNGFRGINDGESNCGGCIPPDGGLSVGPDDVVGVVNTALMVWSKSGARRLSATTDLSAMLLPSGSSVTDAYDPYTVYDAVADRFIVTMGFTSNSGNSTLNIAVTKTNDPTGAWSVFSLPIPGKDFLDFPHAAVSGDAVYVTGDVYDVQSNFVTARIYAFERTALYAGQTPQSASQDVALTAVGSQASTIMPAQNVGATDVMYFLMADIDCLTCSSISVLRWSTPFGASPSFQLMGGVSVSSYVQPPDADDIGAPQSVATNDAGNLETWFDGGTLYGTHAVGVDLGAGTIVGVQWYQVGGIDSTPTLLQEGVLASNDACRYFPSLATDASGGLAVFYSYSSTHDRVGIRMAGRLASDAPGTLGTEVTIKAGTSQVPDTSRWGDYGTTVYDPSSGGLWNLLEYENGSGGLAWDTFVSEVHVVPPPLDFAVTATPGSRTIAAGASAVYTVTIAPQGGYAGTVDLSVGGVPGGGSPTFSSASIAGGSGSVTLTVDTTIATAPGSYALTITASDPTGTPSHAAGVTLVIDRDSSATSLSASPDPSQVGQAVVLRATVTGAAGAPVTPTGTVAFTDGATSLGNATIASGVATITASGLSQGAHSLHATYGGDASFVGSAGSITLTVNPQGAVINGGGSGSSGGGGGGGCALDRAGASPGPALAPILATIAVIVLARRRRIRAVPFATRR